MHFKFFFTLKKFITNFLSYYWTCIKNIKKYWNRLIQNNLYHDRSSFNINHVKLKKLLIRTRLIKEQQVKIIKTMLTNVIIQWWRLSGIVIGSYNLLVIPNQTDNFSLGRAPCQVVATELQLFNMMTNFVYCKHILTIYLSNCLFMACHFEG